MKSAFRTACAAVLLVGALGVQPVLAQAEMTAAANPIYWQSGRWSIRELPNQFCELRMLDALGVSLSYAVDGADRYKGLRAQKVGFDWRTRGYRSVEWEFDGEIFSGLVYATGEYGAIGRTTDIVRNFKTARRLKITHDGDEVFDISLSGSFRAFEKLKECASQWPTSQMPVKPPSAPPPPVPSPVSKSASKPIPLNASEWLRLTDYKPDWLRSGFEGTVRFRLFVDVDGRVETCLIRGGNAPTELKDTTCHLLRERARFEPAVDLQKRPTKGAYTGSVNWRLPE